MQKTYQAAKQWLSQKKFGQLSGRYGRLLHLILKTATAVALASLLAVLSAEYRLQTLNVYWNDILTLTLPKEPPSHNILTVGLDTKAFKKQLGSPFTLDKYEQLLKKLLATQPRMLITEIDPVVASASEKEKREFLEFTQNYPHLYFATIYKNGKPKRKEPHFVIDPILGELKQFFVPLSADLYTLPRDRKMRRFAVTLSAEKRESELMDNLSAHGFNTDVEDFLDGSFIHHGSQQVYLRYRPEGAYSLTPFSDYMLRPDLGNGKIVLLGYGADAASRGLYGWSLYSDISDDKGFMLGVERFAMNIDTAILKDHIKVASTDSKQLLTYILFTLYFLGIFFLGARSAVIWGFIIFFAWVLTTAVAYLVEATYLFSVFIPVALAGIHYIVSSVRLYRDVIHQEQATRDLEVEKLEGRLIAKSARADLGLKLATQVAHDLKSPLMSLSIVAQKSKEFLPREASELLFQSVDRINGISSSLLKRYRQGHLMRESAKESFSLSDALEEILSGFKASWPEVQFEINISANGLIPASKKSDIERAVSNLLMNAVEALKEAETPPPVVATTLSHMESHRYLLEIDDNGPGVPEEVRPHIFTRGKSFGKKSGTGLGLAQASETFTKMGGSIKLDQSPLGGARFSIEIPVQTEETTLEIHSQALIFEDDRSVREEWLRRLKEAGIEAQAFSGLKDFAEDPVQLKGPYTVISDLIFEGEDTTGFDVLQRFQGKNVQRILCTSLGANPDVRATATRYADLVLSKSEMESSRISITS